VAGSQLEKKLRNRECTNEFDPQNYPEYFPGMAPFTDEYRLLAYKWRDCEDDIHM
jgi:hypothetical protein